jgi:hypothetical protein
MNNVLDLHEILHETKRRRETGVVMKFDFKKAYDKVHWCILMKCLKIRGLDDTWCLWVESVLFNGIVAIKLNDIVGSYF